MKIGDRVIINPNVPDNAWSKYGYGFHYSTMRKPGIFILEENHPVGGFSINGYYYDEEWLLPVPLFKVGDSVKIREDLDGTMSLPYGVATRMTELRGLSFNVEEVKYADDADRVVKILGDDGCLYRIEDNNGGFSWSSPMFDLSNYKFKIKSNESRLQEQESPLRGGSGEIKCGICCRKHRPRVTVEPVSYKKVFGRG